MAFRRSTHISTLSVPNTSLLGADFDSVVAPVLAEHCLECHGQIDPQGGLDLSRVESTMQGGDSGVVVTRKNSADSLLWQRIRDGEMPPKHPLSDYDKQIIRDWIDSGADWGRSPIDPFAITTEHRAGYDWWSLQTLRPTVPPGEQNHDWARNDVDRFILAKLESSGLRPSPEASPRSLVRRLYFDLIGLPPSPEVVAKFVANPSEAAWNQLVDQLLESQHYGERWARHWLDVVRFGESDGFERNKPRPNAWPYRDWVITALNNDMPYDEFVRQQLIGDQITGGIGGAAATGFWVAGVHNTVVGGSERMKLLARQDEIEEVLATVGQSFLGLTVNCARCHDHKFDPISQKEFYQLASAISGLGYGERTEESPEDTVVLNELDAQLTQMTRQLSEIDNLARRKVIAARGNGNFESPEPPEAYARWEFDNNLTDSIGTLNGTAHGEAHLKDGALILDGNSFVSTSPLPTDITEKTLEVWVRLDNLTQRGGGAITLQTDNGVVFDSIVFAERRPQQWMPGSNSYVRSESFQGPPESQADKRTTHIAMVYQADGTIVAYRDGIRYGREVRKAALQEYDAGDAEILFGLRHRPGGGNRFLSGRIYKAALYDRALAPAEIAASAGNAVEYVSELELTASLNAAELKTRKSLQAAIQDKAAARERQARRANRRIYTLTAGSGANTHVLLRGDPANVGEEVAPAAIAAVQGVPADFGLPPDAPEAERRKHLADWIANADNPLFSRVIVNRIWHYHFGTGLVDTPNDFGFNGGRPSHPELLEWLAVRLRDNGFRLKPLHRLLVTSSTYRQAAFSQGSDSTGTSVDAGNRLLWRMTPRRLEAESLRDAMLAVAGKLNPRAGGSSFIDVSIVENNGTTYYEPINVDGDDVFRRTIYRFNPRGGRSALLDTFDCPDSANTVPRRAVTITPLQALSLLNNSFVLQMSDYFAQRICSEAGDNVSEQVDRAWQLAVMREATPEEYELSTALVTQYGLAALCRGLFNSTEFVLID
jgi:hypothetical protein